MWGFQHTKPLKKSMISLLRHACNVCCIPIFTPESPVKRHATVPRQHKIHIPEIKCAWRGAALRMRQSLFHYLFISTKQWRRSRNCWDSNQILFQMQIKIFAEARTEAINIIGWLISSSSSQCSSVMEDLYPAHGEDRGKNCRHLQHRPVSQHNLHTAWSMPGQWSGMRFVLWPASRRTRLWRNGLNLNTYCRFLLYWHPPSSIECWLISTMAKNQLSTLCIAQDKDEGDGWKGDHY